MGFRSASTAVTLAQYLALQLHIGTLALVWFPLPDNCGE